MTTILYVLVTLMMLVMGAVIGWIATFVVFKLKASQYVDEFLKKKLSTNDYNQYVIIAMSDSWAYEIKTTQFLLKKLSKEDWEDYLILRTRAM